MALEPHLPGPVTRRNAGLQTRHAAADPAEERKTMAGPRRAPGSLGRPGCWTRARSSADIASFRLHLAAEGKAARTVQGYTSAVRWFAAG